MTDRPPTGDQQGTRQGADTTQTVSVTDAARRLGISPDAVRGRLHRGTLAGVKLGNTWRVSLAALDDDMAPTAEATGYQQDATGDRQGAGRAPDSPLIEQLRSENAYLRGELSARSRELAAERERADVLMREALGKIEALTAGGSLETVTSDNRTDAGEPRDNARGRTRDGPHEEHAGDMDDEASAPWWRRWWRSLMEGP